MSVRLSRGSSIALAISIVVMLMVWAPMMALADSSNSQAPEAPPGQSDEVATTSAPADAGKSADAPGKNKTETSNAKGGGAGTTGGGNSDSHGSKTTTGTPTGKGDGPTTGVGGNNCDGDPSGGSNTGNGANTSGDFDNTCGTSPSGPAPNGNGGGGAKGKPCAGCVGNADDKNPPGQSHSPEDNNKGYECDGNKGIGKSNPAHTGCTPGGGSQDEFDCLGHLLPNNHNHSAEECNPSNPPTCPEDSAQNAGLEIPEGETAESFCNPDVVGAVICPEGTDGAGTVVPDGEDAEEFCDDDVLGKIIDKKPVFPGGPVVAGENLGAPEPKAAVLPFTGGNLLPLLIMSLALMGVGGTTLRRRRDRSAKKEVA